MNTFTEENYLKAIYHLSLDNDNVSTNQIAGLINTKAASVTDMLKKLSDKCLVNYERYQGVTLTDQGKKVAIHIVRKHRLWECFLVDKLNFKWDEVHEMAEELEHISSNILIDRLDEFMGHPKYDPHGDPIPDHEGRLKLPELKPVSVLAVDETGVISGVRDHSATFLQYLEKMELTIGKEITVTDIIAYDQSVVIRAGRQAINISREVAKNLLIV